jgi:uncharacterized protein YecE (DUF72 family)
MGRKGTIRIGTSGYQYNHWRGRFYPRDLPQKEWFAFYAERFDTVEINNTFYQLPRSPTFDAWRKRAPKGFCYAVKMNRYLTHRKRLKHSKAALKRFLARAHRLRETLGPILTQLPPHWNVNEPRLRAFLDAMPAEYRLAVEFRDPSWLTDSIYAALRDHGAALCMHDMIEDHPMEVTARWTYLRFHGNRYHGSYSSRMLKATARQIRGYASRGMDVYVYFNNDAEGYAVRNAADLKDYVGNG